VLRYTEVRRVIRPVAHLIAGPISARMMGTLSMERLNDNLKVQSQWKPLQFMVGGPNDTISICPAALSKLLMLHPPEPVRGGETISVQAPFRTVNCIGAATGLLALVLLTTVPDN
jgi:hypothetical protein